MKTYIQPLFTAGLVFPFIALLITIPYMIHNYRKYGSILFTRTVIIYSFIFYLLCVYFLVVLPLPKNDIQHYSNPMQLIPFNFINDFKNYGYTFTGLRSIITFFKNPVVYQLIFNLMMTLPFGVYFRYYFKRNWIQCLIGTFILSLSFELLQLTGILGLYKYPYRLFDVDDLMVNTCGGMIGYFLTPYLTKYLPSMDKLDEVSYKKGQTVSFFRRLVAYFIDQIIIILMTIIISSVFPTHNTYYLFILLYLVGVLLYYGLIGYLLKGRTLGNRVVKIGLVCKDNTPIKPLNIIIRYALVMMFDKLIPVTIFELMVISTDNSSLNNFLLVLSLILLVIYTIFILRVIIVCIIKKDELLYEELSNTTNISLIDKE
ncbi:MAG: VanZ family protein [Thomasclavelia sp.]|nr:VanZ family protein [Thomasclavelia sp.]